MGVMFFLGVFSGIFIGLLIMALYAFVLVPAKKRKARLCAECAEFPCHKYRKMFALKKDYKYAYATDKAKEAGHITACEEFVDAYDRCVALEIRKSVDVYRKDKNK